MTLTALLPALLTATVNLAPGADLGAAVATARPGDVVQLAPGVYPSSLGRIRVPLRIVGAGAGITVVVAPEGEDGAVVDGGDLRLESLTIRAQGPRSALKVLAGRARAEGVALAGKTGAFVDGGRLDGTDVDLTGGYGLLLRTGEVSLLGARLRGSYAGLGQLGGRSDLRRVAVTGPSREAGLSVSGGSASLEDVVVRSPGPSGLSVVGGARIEARALDISGATESPEGIQGDCIQLRRGTLSVAGAALTRCGGAAVESLGGDVELRGVDATGGEAGCLVFLDKANAHLQGNRCLRTGPAVVAASGAQVHAEMNRWMVDPVLWVDCGSGARVYLGVGETSRQPCTKPGDSLDKPRRP